MGPGPGTSALDLLSAQAQNKGMFDSVRDQNLPSRIIEGTGWRDLFARNRDANSFKRIFFWWEKRRLHYNMILLVVGICSYLVYWHLFDLYAPDPADDGMFPGLGIIVCGFVANVLYTLGWVVESALLLASSRRGLPFFGRLFYIIGLVFSVLLAMLPGIAGVFNTLAMMRANQGHWT